MLELFGFVAKQDGYSIATGYVFDVVEHNVRPWHYSQSARGRPFCATLPLNWPLVKHAWGKLQTLVSTSETQTLINN